MLSYREWLLQQTNERQVQSLELMVLSSILGEEQRKDPQSDECRILTELIASRYKKNYAGDKANDK